MDKIRNISQIMEIVRNQVSNTSSNIKKGATNLTNTTTSRKKRISQEELKKSISIKLSSLKTDEANAISPKEVLLESIILWEFGEQISNDPFFAELTTKIRIAIESNKEASDKLDLVIKQLSKH